MRDVDALLKTLADREGSDLHLKVGSPPLLRFDGVLTRVEGEEPLRPEETEAMAHHLMAEDRWHDFLERSEADLAYSLPGVARFRVNVFRQRGSVSVVLRLVRVGSPSFEELGLPPVVR
ncbi:MAG: type IV pili twitching motility protein PilT, partial [Actinomycetota bacterium]